MEALAVVGHDRRGRVGPRVDGAAVAGAAVEVQPAAALLLHQPLAELGVGLRDHVAVLVVGDRQQPVHALELGPGQPDPAGKLLVDLAEDLALAHVGAHRREPVQDGADDVDVAGGEQVGDVLERDPQVVDRAEDVVGVGLVAVGLQRRDHGGERRHVPDHRQRAELRVQRQRDAPAHREVVDRRAPRGVDPVARDAVARGRRAGPRGPRGPGTRRAARRAGRARRAPRRRPATRSAS